MYRRKDSYYRRARETGLRSRAAFKLEEVGRRLIRRGDRVVDLGSWPGGWLQTASRLVGESGLVVGVDLRALDPLHLGNVRVLEGDVREESTRGRIREALGGAADVVLSDMAPKLTGIRDRDEAAAEELRDLALGVARELLRGGGSFVCKVFMGPGYKPFLEEARRSFARVDATRPDSTRKGSAELYVIATGYRAAGEGVSRP